MSAPVPQGFTGSEQPTEEDFEVLREVEEAWLCRELANAIKNLGYPVGMGIAPKESHLKAAATALFDRYGKMIKMARGMRDAAQAGDKRGDYDHGYADGVEWATTSQPTQGGDKGEPVGWQAREKARGPDWFWTHCDIPNSNPEYEYRPVYAAPQPTTAAKAVDAQRLARDIESGWDAEPTPFNRADVAARIVLQFLTPAYTAADCDEVADLKRRIAAHEQLQARIVHALGRETWQGDLAAAVAELAGNKKPRQHSGTYLGYRDEHGNEMHCSNAFCPHQDKCRKGCVAPVALPSTQSASAATKHSGTYLGYRDESGNEMHCANAFCPHQDKCHKGCARPVAVSSH